MYLVSDDNPEVGKKFQSFGGTFAQNLRAYFFKNPSLGALSSEQQSSGAF